MASSRFGQPERRVGDSIYSVNIMKSDTYTVYLRDVYGIWNIVSDLGGVLSVLISLFALFLDPVNQQLFIYDYMTNLYHVRTDKQEAEKVSFLEAAE